MSEEAESSRGRVSGFAAGLLSAAQSAKDFAEQAAKGVEDPDRLVEEFAAELKDCARALMNAALDESPRARVCLIALRGKQAELEERLEFLKRAPLPVPPEKIEETSELVSEVIANLGAFVLLYGTDEKIEDARNIAHSLASLRQDLLDGKPVSAVAIRGGVHLAVELICGGS